MSIIHRLKSVLDAKGMTIKACAELLEVPYRTLQNYLLAEREPSAEVLVKAGNLLNVDLNWLMTGQGEMFKSNIKQAELTGQEINLLTQYREMSNELKNAFEISFQEINHFIRSGVAK